MHSDVEPKWNSDQERNKIIKLENVTIISEIVFGMVHGQP